jgi:hypothetical protein
MKDFGDHSVLLKELIQKLEEEERPFYDAQATWNYRAWHFMFFVSILISVAAAVTAEAIDGNQFERFGKLVLTILPILATAVTAITNHFRFHEKEALREAGRIDIEDIVSNAKSLAASAEDDEALRKAYHAVRQRAYELEMKQHTVDVALRSKEATQPNADQSA